MCKPHFVSDSFALAECGHMLTHHTCRVCPSPQNVGPRQIGSTVYGWGKKIVSYSREDAKESVGKRWGHRPSRIARVPGEDLHSALTMPACECFIP